MKDSTKKLYQFLFNYKKKSYKLSSLVNNAIDNIIIYILTDGYKVLNKVKIKHNINYYISLARNAQLHGDHHTSILIISAINANPIQRLKIKSGLLLFISFNVLDLLVKSKKYSF